MKKTALMLLTLLPIGAMADQAGGDSADDFTEGGLSVAEISALAASALIVVGASQNSTGSSNEPVYECESGDTEVDGVCVGTTTTVTVTGTGTMTSTITVPVTYTYSPSLVE